MAYSIEELNPAKTVIFIDKKTIEISPITLHKEIIFKAMFGSLDKTFDAINEKPNLIINVIWELVDKSIFDFSFEVFYISLYKNKGSSDIWAKDLMKAFQYSVEKSMPLIKNQKRYREIQKIKDTGKSEKPCYADYFDTVGKRYGHTLDQFFNLTLRQIHILLTLIGDKSYEELEVRASLAGMKLKPRMKFDDISEEEEKENTAQALEALKELQRKYEENKKGE